MGPDLELAEASGCELNGVVLVDSQHRCLKHDTYCKLQTLKLDRSGVESSAPSAACTCNEMDVNVTDVTHTRGNEMVTTEDEEETDSSSSFDDSDCGIHDLFSDTEVGSHNHGDITSDLEISGFDKFLRMRRKKLTSHWKQFIQPLMWRCRWLELQIKKCNSQALKYDRELAAYNFKESVQSGNCSKEGLCVKPPLPFSTDDIPRDKVMHRKKRRKIEDTADIASYISNHILFSYEDKRHHAANGAHTESDSDTQDPTKKMTGYDDHEADERIWLQGGDVDVLLEGLFRKIETLQSKVNNMRTRLNKVTSENAGKFSLAVELGLLVSSIELSSHVQSLSSPPSSGDRMPVLSSCVASELQSQHNMGQSQVQSQHNMGQSQHNMGSLPIPKNAVSSNGDASHIPVAVGSTDQINLQDKCMKVENKVLAYNDSLKEETNNFGEAIIQPIEKPQVATSCQQGTVPVVLDEPKLPNDDQPAPKIRPLAKLIAPMGKKKRGKRRASSWWTQRVSG